MKDINEEADMTFGLSDDEITERFKKAKEIANEKNVSWVFLYPDMIRKKRSHIWIMKTEGRKNYAGKKAIDSGPPVILSNVFIF